MLPSKEKNKRQVYTLSEAGRTSLHRQEKRQGCQKFTFDTPYLYQIHVKSPYCTKRNIRFHLILLRKDLSLSKDSQIK